MVLLKLTVDQDPLHLDCTRSIFHRYLRFLRSWSDDQTIDRLKVKIVCGAANNQLSESRHGDMLKGKGILYAPDYLINAGGVMNVSIESEGCSAEKVMKMVDGIFDTTLKI